MKNSTPGNLWLMLWAFGYVLRVVHITGAIFTVIFVWRSGSVLPLYTLIPILFFITCIALVSYEWLIFTWTNKITTDDSIQE